MLTYPNQLKPIKSAIAEVNWDKTSHFRKRIQKCLMQWTNFSETDGVKMVMIKIQRGKDHD